MRALADEIEKLLAVDLAHGAAFSQERKSGRRPRAMIEAAAGEQCVLALEAMDDAGPSRASMAR